MDVQRIAAFSDGPVGGNPAGVVLCDALPPAERMQAVAAEVGYSETAFAAPVGDDWRVRYFAPAIEVPFCGHATPRSRSAPRWPWRTATAPSRCGSTRRGSPWRGGGRGQRWPLPCGSRLREALPRPQAWSRTAWRCSPTAGTTWTPACRPRSPRPAPGTSSWPWPAGRGCRRCATTWRSAAGS